MPLWISEMASDLITQDELKRVLRYDPETGDFIWLISKKGLVRNTFAGHRNKRTKYLEIRINGQLYLGHRLAWLYMTGEWPKKNIDHRDLDGSNDRWRNLRECNQSQNMANGSRPKHNTSGLKGAGWCKSAKRWRAQIKKNKKNMFIGYFDTVEEAHAAYMRKARELFGEFARAE